MLFDACVEEWEDKERKRERERERERKKEKKNTISWCEVLSHSLSLTFHFCSAQTGVEMGDLAAANTPCSERGEFLKV